MIILMQLYDWPMFHFVGCLHEPHFKQFQCQQPNKTLYKSTKMSSLTLMLALIWQRNEYMWYGLQFLS